MVSHDVAYALECVFVPMAWGLVVMWLSMLVQKRAKKHAAGSDAADANPHEPGPQA